MTKIESYKEQLVNTQDWIQYLLDNSNLPGKRANLELLQAVSVLGNEDFFNQCLDYNELIAPTNTPGEFVAACGTTGIGHLIAEGKREYYKVLQEMASDRRWRIREAVAFALQIIGKKEFDELIEKLSEWVIGNPYEKRAVVAGLCEPDLLKINKNAEKVLYILLEISESILKISERKTEAFIALKKGLGYGLSVAIVASPQKGKKMFEKLVHHPDKDLHWILKENLKKNRLIRLDKEWVGELESILKQPDK